MNLADAIARFREIDEATIAMSVGPFMKGLAVSKKQDPDEEEDERGTATPPAGGIPLLRRTAPRIGR